MDLSSINANINRLLTNIWAVISFLKEFAVDSAKDVSITYINADGSENVKTFPNIAKMVATYNITNDNGVIRDLSGNVLGAEPVFIQIRHNREQTASNNIEVLNMDIVDIAVGGIDVVQGSSDQDYVVIPKNGYYEITVCLNMSNGTSLNGSQYFYVRKNTAPILGLYAQCTNSMLYFWQTLSKSMIVYLRQGDKIDIYYRGMVDNHAWNGTTIKRVGV